MVGIHHRKVTQRLDVRDAALVDAEIKDTFETAMKGLKKPFLQALAQITYDYIAQRARSDLQSSRGAYLSALTLNAGKAYRPTITLRGNQLASMVEAGHGAFDIRDTMLTDGRNRRVIRMQSDQAGKHTEEWTRHRAIRSADRPLQDLVGAEAAKVLGTKTMRFLARSKRPRQAGTAPLLRKHHNTDIFDRMRRETKMNVSGKGKKRRVTHHYEYAIYRTLSRTHGAGQSWMHPGIKARDFFGAAASRMDSFATLAKDRVLGGRS